MCLLVDVKFTRKKIDLVAGCHRGSDSKNAGLGSLRQNDLVFVFTLFVGFEFGAADFEFDLRVADRAVITESIQVEGDLFAAENAHKFEGF